MEGDEGLRGVLDGVELDESLAFAIDVKDLDSSDCSEGREHLSHCLVGCACWKVRDMEKRDGSAHVWLIKGKNSALHGWGYSYKFVGLSQYLG